MDFDAPRDNLVRAISGTPALRADAGGDGNTLYGKFAVFNEWTEINSMFEGRFLERLAPGAFDRTITENRDRVKVLYDHGRDPSIGNKPLGPLTDLSADNRSANYEVQLLDTSYNRDLKPAIEAGLLGASFRFSVVSDEIVQPTSRNKRNPEMLPERTITDVDLYELGPVTFPAYASATAAMRSMTDEFFESLLSDPMFVARFTERVGLRVAEPILASLPTSSQRDVAQPSIEEVAEVDESAGGHSEQRTIPTDLASRKMLARQIEAFRMGLGKGY